MQKKLWLMYWKLLICPRETIKLQSLLSLSQCRLLARVTKAVSILTTIQKTRLKYWWEFACVCLKWKYSIKVSSSLKKHNLFPLIRWRTKQNLDYSFLMMYAQPRGTFYLQVSSHAALIKLVFLLSFVVVLPLATFSRQFKEINPLICSFLFSLCKL